LLAGIVAPSGGSICVLGTDLVALKSGARDRFRAEHMGIIFQMFNLLPYASVLDNVLLPLHFAPERRRRTAVDGGPASTARGLMTNLGLEPELLSTSAAKLSVGQQQRVAAARALIGAPELVIADEPTSSLDRVRQRDFLALLFADLARANATLAMVSHDESLADRFTRVEHLSSIAVTVRGEGS
jgi:putative ABC transport system ATP-binding protein